MPKGLSLKKAHQTVPPKNQKAITSFFKNTNTQVNQKLQHSPDKNELLESKCLANNALKRKAESSVPLEIIELFDDNDPVVNNVNSCYLKSLQHTPKKFKLERNVEPRTKNIDSKLVKKSPQKENELSCSTKSPHEANGNHYKIPHEKECDGTYKSFLETDLEQSKHRSPLTPVKLANFMESIESNSRTSFNQKIIDSRFIEQNNHAQYSKSKVITPKKVLYVENHDQNISQSPGKRGRTPKKSQIQELNCSPKIAKLKTPESINDDLSPSKSGSTIKVLDFGQDDEMFNDEWDIGDVDESFENACIEDLDLSIMQRCQVDTVTKHPTRLELKLKNSNNNRGTCFVEGIWLDTPISPGEVVSVLATLDSSGQFYVGNSSGLLILRPDHLISSTSVVAGVFCKRKALLQERWKGIDSANTAMTIGILIHELVQKALAGHIFDIAQLRAETDRIIKGSIQMLYDAGLSEEEARSSMQTYISPLAEFMQMYVADKPLVAKQGQKDQWTGHIDEVLDIEENVCCPRLGLKGKIDATLQVTIHERKGCQRAIVPLELKSGKASASAEHRGQLVLYGMMLSLQRSEDPARALQRGLLLYLRDRIDVREVSCGYPERRDLVMLRNQLVQYLAVGPQDADPEQLTDIEDATCLLQQRLPEPVHHETACAKCPYLTICSLHLWHTDGPVVSNTHPLAKLREPALGHLSPEHINYFLHWTALLKMEERGQMTASPLHSLWTDSVDKRTKKGTCAANLKLKAVEPSGDRFLHVFERQTKAIETLNDDDDNRVAKGPQEGDFSIVSIDNRPWIAAGVVSVAKVKEIRILLERDLSRRLQKDTSFHIDTYSSYATTVQNLTNLGVLLEDSDHALRLRNLIINKDVPEFEKKLPREVGRLGSRLMRALNIEQQRAVLRALAARDYALLQGLPGTGKTQTISVLIQMLVGLKQRVLVTAHTHSAVDTVLSRLPESVRVMRLGSSARVSANLLPRCEQRLSAACETVEQLRQLYDSMEVVGVTCLGAAHAMLSRTPFDVCVVDEATQVLQSTVLRPLLAARRFVLVGDPDQLPPVVRSRAARRLGMEESLFHRLMSADATSTLQLQYRMNQPLADVANRVAYRARLRCADQAVALATLDIDLKKLSHYSEAQWLLTACSPEPGQAALFLDTRATSTTASDSSKNCSNSDEACVVLALVDALIEGGIKPKDIGVIAPYRDQVSLLRRALSRRGAEGSTVDQFQGRDKSVIVYSCTKRDDHDDRRTNEGEILNDQRRLAVSVTRAKHKLLIVGNSRALQRYEPLRRLIEACTTLPLDENAMNKVLNKYRIEFM